MRAAVYHGGGRIAVEERPDPVAGPGELVVRVRACGLCGSDLMSWYQDPRAPLVLGHEPAGEVVQAGPGAPFAEGARVFVHHHVPCMTCALCRAGRQCGADLQQPHRPGAHDRDAGARAHARPALAADDAGERLDQGGGPLGQALGEREHVGACVLGWHAHQLGQPS
ncbi:MAG TPA: alcohol dehydrogenase catalytic domain-containing protein, partial [Miltoncostaeaceae bacterium]|nr:alcohol dehydrogenase catalytic domain-containing protein [Miltoncostaeaceae bacterium]